MQFNPAVRSGTLIKRYKRFFADFLLDGDSSKAVQVAHVANTGSLQTVLTGEPQPCLVSPSTNPERKLKWTLEAVQGPLGTWIGVNTSWPNRLAVEIFQEKILAHWQDFDDLQSEVKINSQTRLDLCLTSKKTQKKHFVEIKNVTLKKVNESLAFPDSVTERGQKHLRELMHLLEQGRKAETSAEILFFCQRMDSRTFSPADEIDPEYGRLLRQAAKKGVLVTAVQAEVSASGIQVLPRLLKVNL
jgi:sugar fermentation stimulation protein A